MKLSALLREDRIADLKASSKKEGLNELIDLLNGAEEIKDLDGFRKAILQREKVMTTALGEGIAVPHAKVGAVAAPFVALGRSKRGIDFSAPDDRPVRLVVLIGAPAKETSSYLQILSKVISLLIDDSVKNDILQAKGTNGVLKVIKERE
jgi:PTS system fructose-specific IIC component